MSDDFDRLKQIVSYYDGEGPRPERMNVDQRDATEIGKLLEAHAAAKLTIANLEAALRAAMRGLRVHVERAERFEAQAAEHWVRLARCRGALVDPETTDEERAEILAATATNDAPATAAMERARERLEAQAQIRHDEMRPALVLAKAMLGMAFDYYAGHLPYSPYPHSYINPVEIIQRCHAYERALLRLWRLMNEDEWRAAGPLESAREV